VIVWFDYRIGRKAPLTDDLRKRIEALENAGAELPPQQGD